MLFLNSQFYQIASKPVFLNLRVKINDGYLILQITKFSKISYKKKNRHVSAQHCLSLYASVAAPGLCVFSLLVLHLHVHPNILLY